MIVLLVHGWGFDASFWTPLREALGEVETVAWDLGFRGRPSRPALPEGRTVVAVGHSFGLLWLLHERPLRWQALVSINGFPRFTRAPDFPAGVAPRLVERMISRFATAPEAVYSEFMARCGAPAEASGELDLDALRAGLVALAEWDGRDGTGRHGVDLALAGRRDPIAPAGMTLAGFDARPIEWQDGGHLLPLEAPAWCAGRLRRMISAMRDRRQGTKDED
jgi:pimeloyl-[acyl-carrier protein] methyl ester esterase